MKTNVKINHYLAVPLCGFLLAGSLTACETKAATNMNERTAQGQAMSVDAAPNLLQGIDFDVEPTRTNYAKLTEELKTLYEQNPQDNAIALAYAEKLLQLGDIADANTVLNPILSSEFVEPQALFLSAKLEYLTGNYDKSEMLYDTLMKEYPAYDEDAVLGLEYVYYQTNQYQKAHALSPAYGNYVGDMMRGFGDRVPYQIEWAAEEETTIPFLVTDPLPVIQAEVNGELKNFIVDTGASDTYLDESVANMLGLKPIASVSGEYAGDVTVETNFGVLDSYKLKGVTLTSIPVIIADIAPFSVLFDYEISGVVGTGVFKEFHVTMDYLNGELVLRPKEEQVQIQSVVAEMPFVLSQVHSMLCKAKVNGKEMNMFVDSGLASAESLLLPKASLEYAEIPMPELYVEDSLGGLGGSGYDIGDFTASYQMGDLPIVHNIMGNYGVFPESSYFSEGIFMDGIISHNYLKNYIWTINFDTMTMTFSS